MTKPQGTKWNDRALGARRLSFWDDLPQVRVVTAHPDGTLTGYETIAPQVFGGHIPNVGDVIGDVWGSQEYDFQVVQRRYFIREFRGDTFWLLVMRDADANAQFDQISTNVLLVSDLYEFLKVAPRPLDRSAARSAEFEARMAQLTSPSTAKKTFKPKRRDK